jgi:hypothetical protein
MPNGPTYIHPVTQEEYPTPSFALGKEESVQECWQQLLAERRALMEQEAEEE